MADLSFPCPACGQHLSCDPDLIGAGIECPECGVQITVSEPEEPRESPEADEAESAEVDEPAPDSAEDEAAAGVEAVEGPDEEAAEAEPAAAGETLGEELAGENGKQAEATPAKGGKETNPVIARYTQDGQTESAVKKVLEGVGGSMAEEETLEYIAVQHHPLNPLGNIEPACVALTDRRLIICRPKLLGRMEFEEFPWIGVLDLRLSEKIAGATLSFRTMDDEPVAVEHIPKPQARRLYAVAQQCEEAARERRRLKTIDRTAPAAARRPAAAPARQPVPAADAAASKIDPVLRLKQLKEAFDSGLITRQDYAAKKKAILGEI